MINLPPRILYMKRNRMLTLLAVAALATGLTAQAADCTAPIAPADLVFDEVDGIVAVEAEHFYKQTLADQRAWHITSPKHAPDVKPDGDPAHLAGASGGAYVECLPDTRRTHGDKLINGENFSDQPGELAVLHYKVHFHTPGRYYVWVRAFSTGSEDNGIHVGLSGQWPESGRRMQWCEGKQSWRWDSKQRTPEQHCGEPYKIHLDVTAAGDHEILFSLREDGFEFDKFFLTTNREFPRPEDSGPTPRVKSGTLPPAFAAVAAPAPAPAPAAAKKFPAHWGQPPAIQTRDLRPLPGGYGEGSGTLAKWIQENLDKDAAVDARSLKMEATSFPLENSGYYLDKGKWLAINPANHQTAKSAAPFPYASGHYHVTLQAVGESDGQSTYEVLVNDTGVGTFTCPLSTETFEEGSQFHMTWKHVALNQGDVVTVSSQIASENGQEHSRARIARLTFEPADESAKAAAAKVAALAKPAAAPALAKPLRPLVQPRQPDGSGAVVISGELKQWHKVTLTLDGPFAHERDNEPNPFTDYALSVTFTHESGAPRYTVPGYFAADGSAANTSAESGTKWRAHLSPDKPGRWTYAVAFVKGKHVAGGDAKGESLKPFAGPSGMFTIAPTDKAGRDFRAQGRLQYVGKHHLQFAGSKEFFLKAGADAPENLLSYRDFDGDFKTDGHKDNLVKDWKPHVQDWKPGDPTWQDGRGKGLIGAVNYLAGKGANAISFLTLNIGGDDQNVFPYVSHADYAHLDVSRLEQWEIVFNHAQERGLFLHFKTQEAENQGLLDGGDVGPQRRLYYRELIARFGHHLALNWNMGEEIGPWQKNPPTPPQGTPQRLAMAEYFHQNDPYHHHVVIHNGMKFDDILGSQSRYTGVSIQYPWNAAHQRTLEWLSKSAAANRGRSPTTSKTPLTWACPPILAMRVTAARAFRAASLTRCTTSGRVVSGARCWPVVGEWNITSATSSRRTTSSARTSAAATRAGITAASRSSSSARIAFRSGK